MAFIDFVCRRNVIQHVRQNWLEARGVLTQNVEKSAKYSES